MYKFTKPLEYTSSAEDRHLILPTPEGRRTRLILPLLPTDDSSILLPLVAVPLVVTDRPKRPAGIGHVQAAAVGPRAAQQTRAWGRKRKILWSGTL